VKLTASRWVIAIAAAFPLLCAYSCAVPLGPGYHIEKETVELRFTNQPQPRLHFDGHYRLKNVGNAPLASLDVTVPEKDALARQNLRISVDGKDTPITERSATRHPLSIAPISFEPAWPAGEQREIEIAFDRGAGSDGHTVVTSDALAFDGDYWFPAFHAPNRLFAKGEQRADRTELVFTLPNDFLATASGLQIGRKVRGDAVEYRFRLQGQSDVPFVVAGRYKQQIAKNHGVSVYFRTIEGLPEDAVQIAGKQLADAAKFFDSDFTARGHGESPVWVVEKPAGAISHRSTASFPSVLLLDKSQVADNVGRGQVTPAVIGLLTETWLEWITSPDRTGNDTLPSALTNYMVDAFEHSQPGGPDRAAKITELLRQYDMYSARAMEKPIAQIVSGDSPDQVNMAVTKAGLLLYALEDSCTAPVVRRSIGTMVSTLRGAQYGYQDFRAAVNIQCGRPEEMDRLFRTWLYEKGIPADFSQRYADATAAQETR
jgi:hypothetical protein